MIKLILTQIMKNESHVAERMLNTIKGFADGIVIIDTGSNDNSIELVKKWGEDNKIETYVFERAFDNFENCRNYSFEKAREIFLSKNDGNTYYNFWLDFDEELILDSKFQKNTINKDIYMFTTQIGTMTYTRNELCRLDKPFQFYGPVHEYIRYVGSEQITSGLLEGLKVNVKMDGGSWKTDVSEKYRKHAAIYEDYIRTNNDPRWLFYTAQSWHDSATTNSREENEERWRRSLKYYKERASRMDGYEEERYYSQLRVGTIKKMLEDPWMETHQELLKAYSMDPSRVESLKVIIDYYLSVAEWNMAYLYTKFCKINFHNKSPYPKKLLFVDESLYKWRLLESHAAACFYCGKIDEGKQTFEELLLVVKQNPELFSQEDMMKISSNSKIFK